jgi:hypothetical protein
MLASEASNSTTTGNLVAGTFRGKSVWSVIRVGEAAAKIWQAVTPGGLPLLETPLAESR